MGKSIRTSRPRPTWSRLCLGAAGLAIAGFIVSCGGDGDSVSTANKPPAAFEVSVLSSPRPDLISGGDTLLQVRAPAGASLADAQVLLNGADVTSQLDEKDPDGVTMRGVVKGLKEAAGGADNDLKVVNKAHSDTAPATMTLRNYPITGPILSGSERLSGYPFECRLTQNGLTPVDPSKTEGDCSAVTQVDYYYRSTAGSWVALTDTSAALPSDVANTTTTDGKTVPYIVRIESGTINRGIYRLAVLDNPKTNVTPAGGRWKPSASWNRKLIAFFGCCGSAQYNQGTQSLTSALNDLTLSQGFAYMNSSEMFNQQHSNPHMQGETLMMLKEHFIEEFGVPKWTAGTGGSGGSIQQYLIAQLYPGLLDGIQPSVSFPDSQMPDVTDCRLLNNVYKADSTTWTTAKQNAVNGFNTGTCTSWDVAFASVIKSDNAAGCGYTTGSANAANVFNRLTNPTGYRCDTYQSNVNAWGYRPGTREARRGDDNIGVQYGLEAFNKGLITADEFLDLNEKIGGYDRDGNPTGDGTRPAADPGAAQAGYEAGLKNSFSGPGLANIPIITSRSNANATSDIHDNLQDLIIRARLQKAQGRSDNQIILFSGPTPAGLVAEKSLDMMNRWLDAIVADPAPLSTDKVVRLKPADAVDTCWDASGNAIQEVASRDPNGRCNQIFPRFSTVRLTAGMPIDGNLLKCTLKPLDPRDYLGSFTQNQLVRLNSIFRNGVCDWTKPGVEYKPLRGTYLKLPLQ